MISATKSSCTVCGGPVEIVLDLPALPLTDTFCREPAPEPIPPIDQSLLFCRECGHGLLERQIAPSVLYGTNYCFRTSTSSTARIGTQFFLNNLDCLAPGRTFRTVLDVGCNDLYLLQQLKSRVRLRIGIDPLWKGREQERPDADVLVFGANFEDVDLKTVLPERPDLVVCRHTLEHIQDPAAVLRMLLQSAADNALFVFEVPGFDGLVRRFRFDQVFHQHLQYFSFASFRRLLREVGADFVAAAENYHDWGSMLIAFTNGSNGAGELPIPWFDAGELRRRYRVFREQMEATLEVLSTLTRAVYGYGAAQMLPVLAYHLGSDLSLLECVLDDDPAKDGIRYWNLPVRVASPASVRDLAEASVLVTAVDNAQPILKKLLQNRPRHLVLPLSIF